jgi:hypothetical protein
MVVQVQQCSHKANFVCTCEALPAACQKAESDQRLNEMACIHLRQNDSCKPWLVAVRENGVLSDRIALVVASTPREALTRAQPQLRTSGKTARVYSRGRITRFTHGD